MNISKPANRREILNRIENLQDKALSILQTRQKILTRQKEMPQESELWQDLAAEYAEWGRNLEDIDKEIDEMKERLA